MGPCRISTGKKMGLSVLMGSYNESRSASFNVEGMIENNDCESFFSAVYFKYQTVLDNPNTISWRQLQGLDPSRDRKNLADGY